MAKLYTEKMMDWTDVEMELCATGQEQLAQWMQDEVQQMHGLLLWALYHHQGASSPVGQPIRRALGIDAHARLTAKQVTLAKQAAGSLPFSAEMTATSAVDCPVIGLTEGDLND